MLGQEKNIKGFNLLELIVVIAIIGAISAAAYPNFSKWSKERKIRYGTEKLIRVLKDIKVQTDRATFAYVQVLFQNNENGTQGCVFYSIFGQAPAGSSPS